MSSEFEEETTLRNVELIAKAEYILNTADEYDISFPKLSYHKKALRDNQHPSLYYAVEKHIEEMKKAYIDEGYKIGHKKGVELGTAKATTDFVVTLLQNSCPLPVIYKWTELKLAEVREIAQKHNLPLVE